MLHRAGGKPLVEHVLETALHIAPAERIFVVVGYQADRVREALASSGVGFIEQAEQKGTGHAVLAGRVGSTPASSFTVVSDSQIVAQPPTTTLSGTVYVTASDAAGTSSDVPGDEYTEAPVAPFPVAADGWPVSFSTGTYMSYTFGDYPNGVPTPVFTETGALPPGLSFGDGADGVATISGVPSAGSGGTWPVTVTDSDGVAPDTTLSFDLTVDQPPAITSAGSASFTVAQHGSFDVTATGYPAPAYSESGTLPSGVTFSSSGVLSGTPVAAGEWTFTVTASDTDYNTGEAESAGQSFTLTVGRGAPTTPYVSNVPSAAVVGGGFVAGVSTDGDGVRSVTSSTPSVCSVSGLEVSFIVTGLCTLTADVAQGADYLAGDGAAQTLAVAPAPSSGISPSFTGPTSVSFTVGVAGSFTFGVTGSPAPSVTASGSVPGMAWNGATLSGVPTQAGTYTTELSAVNTVGSNGERVTVTVESPSTTTPESSSTTTPPSVTGLSAPRATGRLGAATASSVRVSLTCGGSECRGFARLVTDSGTRLGSVHFSLARGRTSTVTLRLVPKGVRLLSLSGARGLKVVLTVVARSGRTTERRGVLRRHAS